MSKQALSISDEAKVQIEEIKVSTSNPLTQ